MRTPRFNMHPTQTKVGVMTGGVKENKSQLQLNIGDLIRGVNYQEVDGVYKGYLSLEGYEVTDGTALASSINVPIIEDYGVDRFTYLLLEGDLLVDKLLDMNIFSTICKDNTLYIPSKSKDVFTYLIKPYIIPSMLYKLH